MNFNWFSDKLGLGESTLHDRLNNPVKFQESELIKIAEFLCLEFEYVKCLSYEFMYSCASEEIKDVKREYSETRVEELKNCEVKLESVSHLKFKKVGFILLIALITTFFGIALVISAIKVEKKQISESVPMSALYNGTGIDINRDVFSELKSFHSKLYTYEFKDLKFTRVGENITVKGLVIYAYINEPAYIQIGELVGTGQYIGDKVALVYKIKDDVDNDIWLGTVMLHMPFAGPANGYWMTIHNDEDPAGTGPFAIGSINLKKPILSGQSI
ncbi:hypothetical protein [Pseudoalteromonas denitrificans]|nr:hypothetical protein [Pseudoalteromonas denitrificans]